MSAGLGIGWGISWGSITLAAKSLIDYLTFKLNFNTIATDFTFTRNSFATRVNEFGLIETVTDLGSDLVQNGSFDELSAELVTNGDFATDSDWTKVNATISDGKGNIDSTSATSLLFQSNVLIIGKTYKATLEVSNYNGIGTCALINSDGVIQQEFTSNGVKEFYFTHGGSATNLTFRAISGGIFSIDNVSVKQVDPNDDWTLGTNWSISNGRLVHTQGSTDISYQNLIGITSGKTYILNYNISGRTVGQLDVRMNATVIDDNVQVNGDRSVTFVSNGNNRIIFAPTNLFDGSIDNVVVQEVLEDDVPRIDYTGSTFDVPVLGNDLVTNGDFATDSNWVKQFGWTISGGTANYYNPTNFGNGNIYQTCMVVGKTYEVTFTILNYVSGNVRFANVNGSQSFSGNGTYTYNFVTTSDRLFINTATPNTELSIDNVILKEVVAYTTTDKGAFLLEPISTNLITYSEDYSNLSSVSNAVVTSDSITSPRGLVDADEITFDGTSFGRVETSISTTIGETYTLSVYLKNKDLSDVTQVWLGFSQSAQGQFVTITNDWQRYELQIVADGTTEYPRIQYSGTGSLYAWGFQTEELSYATSYIPTSGTTVTRAQESCVKQNLTTDGFFGGKEGVIFLNTTDMAVVGTSLNSFTPFRLYRQSGDLYRFYYETDASFIGGNIDLSANGGELKIAFSVSETEITVYVNGNLHVIYTIVNPMLSDLEIWNWSTETKYKERVKDFRIYNKALTDDELIDLTTI